MYSVRLVSIFCPIFSIKSLLDRPFDVSSSSKYCQQNYTKYAYIFLVWSSASGSMQLLMPSGELHNTLIVYLVVVVVNFK